MTIYSRIICVFLFLSTLLGASAVDPEGGFGPKKIKPPYKNKSQSLVFVILCHVRNAEDNELWKKCHQSVRKFYPFDPIVIIDDNSPLPVFDARLPNTTFIRSEFPGAGELLPYYYFLKFGWKKKMVFLHDSMYLHRAFTLEELEPMIRFHWHFEVHAWDNVGHINKFLSYLPNKDLLIDYYNERKEEWWGCFGVSSVIDLNVLKMMELEYSFIENLIEHVRTREDRMALERIFGLLFFHAGCVSKENCSNCGSIIGYLGYPSFKPEVLQEIEKNPSSYPYPILKTFRGR